MSSTLEGNEDVLDCKCPGRIHENSEVSKVCYAPSRNDRFIKITHPNELVAVRKRDVQVDRVASDCGMEQI